LEGAGVYALDGLARLVGLDNDYQFYAIIGGH
jgi:hypothetical protein